MAGLDEPGKGAVLAWYACLAGVSASTFGRAVLPNPPLYRM